MLEAVNKCSHLRYNISIGAVWNDSFDTIELNEQVRKSCLGVGLSHCVYHLRAIYFLFAIFESI